MIDDSCLCSHLYSKWFLTKWSVSFMWLRNISYLRMQDVLFLPYFILFVCGNWSTILNISWYSDKAMGLDNLEFSKTSRPALGSTQPPIEWVPEVVSTGVNWPGRVADLSLPASTEVKNRWSYNSAPPLYLHTLHRDFTFFIILWTNNTTHYGIPCHFWSVLLPHKFFLQIVTRLTYLINTDVNLTQWHITVIAIATASEG
jgi:hypothetical protein